MRLGKGEVTPEVRRTLPLCKTNLENNPLMNQPKERRETRKGNTAWENKNQNL
jgi:hypothetical protein